MTELRWTLSALVGHWRRRPGQFAALLAGLALATALWSGVQGVNAQARDSYARAAAMLGGADAVAIARPEGGTFDQRLFVTLRRAGWPVSPVVEGRVRVGDRALRIVGVEPLTLPAGGAVAAAGAAEADDAATLLGDPRAAFVAPGTLAEFGLAEGATPETRAGETLPRLVQRPGVAAATAVMDIGAAQRLLGLDGQVSRLLAPAGFAADGDALAALTDGRLAVMAQRASADLERLTDSFHLNLTAFAFLSFAVGLFIVHASVGLAFEQRLGTIRTLRACGVSARTLAAALLAELVGLALVAGLIGVAIGYVVAGALLPDVAATLRGLYGAPVGGRFSVAPEWWLAGLGMSLAGALLAAGGKLLAAWRLPVLAPAQPNAWAAAQRARLARQGWAAVGLLMLSAMIARSGDSLTAGFALMGALLVGAALALPPILAALLGRGAEAARPPLLRWALSDARQALSGLSLALMALLLALSANIGVGAMVGSFRDAFTGWLDQRLAADIYVRVGDDAQAAAFESAARGLPQVRAVLPSRDVEARIRGFPVDLEGLADDPTYRENWPLMRATPDVWDRLSSGEAALVSEQTARRLNLALGDEIVAPGAERPWPLTVVGVYPDYGNPQGQVITNIEAHRARWPEAARGAYGLRVAKDATEAVIAALRDDPALAGAEIVDQRSVKDFSLSVFERTFAVTGALNALTLGVAGVALFASLTTLAGMRLPQVAPLWAMGVPRRRIAWLELGKTLGLAALTAGLAVPLGVALAWALVAVVNVQAFGWRLPLEHYPADWLRLAVLALATAALAAALPAIRLARTPPARLAQVFAQDR